MGEAPSRGCRLALIVARLTYVPYNLWLSPTYALLFSLHGCVSGSGLLHNVHVDRPEEAGSEAIPLRGTAIAQPRPRPPRPTAELPDDPIVRIKFGLSGSSFCSLFPAPPPRRVLTEEVAAQTDVSAIEQREGLGGVQGGGGQRAEGRLFISKTKMARAGSSDI